MGQFNQYSVGVGAERRGEKKYLLGADGRQTPSPGCGDVNNTEEPLARTSARTGPLIQSATPLNAGFKHS